VALEIDRIERFPSAAKLAAYAGLVPTTYSSGGHTFHGKLMPQTNKWLRWALVEAAWVAIGLDPYFPRALRPAPRAQTSAECDHRHSPPTARGGMAGFERKPPLPDPATRRFAAGVEDFLGCPRNSLAV